MRLRETLFLTASTFMDVISIFEEKPSPSLILMSKRASLWAKLNAGCVCVGVSPLAEVTFPCVPPFAQRMSWVPSSVQEAVVPEYDPLDAVLAMGE